MPRYFIELSYDGTAYHGWQLQPNAISVQEVINNALHILIRDEVVSVVGAGRTDTGVHAEYFVAHFDVANRISDEERMLFKLNAILPPDVAVHSLQEVDPQLHARFSAKSRTYYYRVALRKQPFGRNVAYQPIFPLDFCAMNRAAAILTEYTDFTSFSRLHTDTKTNDCTMMKAEWLQTDEWNWTFVIKANRFLRNMVRAIVGTLFDVGRGKISEADFRRIIEEKNRCRAGSSAPPQGLSLVDIEYPEGFAAQNRLSNI